MSEWNQVKVQQYIDNEVEEGTTLDYKDARALNRSPSKKKEIAKDVSAMANAAGGIIIYGVSESGHLPQTITPVDRTEFSKEWLDQVITHNIQPSIKGMTIHPVNIDTAPEHVVYVVEIPQSTTAHQVTAEKDYRYYERSNFEVVKMEHYRIREVMNRATSPDAEAEFHLIKTVADGHYCLHTLKATVRNTGLRTVERFKLRLTFPSIGVDLVSASNPPDFRLLDVNNEAGWTEHHMVVSVDPNSRS